MQLATPQPNNVRLMMMQGLNPFNHKPQASRVVKVRHSDTSTIDNKHRATQLVCGDWLYW